MQARADYTQARQYYERAVAIHRKTAGADFRQEGNALSALGVAQARSGEFQRRAQASLEEALAIRSRYFAPDTLNTAATLMEYAGVLRDLREYAKSEAALRRALGIIERVLGQDHVMGAEGMSQLGALLALRGRPSDAVRLLERALAIEEKVYSPQARRFALVPGAILAGARAALGEWTTGPRTLRTRDRDRSGRVRSGPSRGSAHSRSGDAIALQHLSKASLRWAPPCAPKRSAARISRSRSARSPSARRCSTFRAALPGMDVILQDELPGRSSAGGDRTRRMNKWAVAAPGPWC